MVLQTHWPQVPPGAADGSWPPQQILDRREPSPESPAERPVDPFLLNLQEEMSLVAPRPPGEEADFDERRERASVTKAVREFCDVRTEESLRLSHARRMFRAIPRLARADEDEHGDVYPSRHVVWDDVAEQLAGVIIHGYGDWEQKSAELSRSAERSGDDQVMLGGEVASAAPRPFVESDEIIAAAVIQLVMIGDVVSTRMFLRMMMLLQDMGDPSESLIRAVDEFRYAHEEVEDIGEMLAMDAPHIDLTTEEWLWTRQKFVRSNRFPMRMKQMFVANVVELIVTANSGDLVISATRALYHMLPGVGLTPRNLPWWRKMLELLQLPLQVTDHLTSVVENFRGLPIQEIRRRLRLAEELASGDAGAEPRVALN